MTLQLDAGIQAILMQFLHWVFHQREGEGEGVTRLLARVFFKPEKIGYFYIQSKIRMQKVIYKIYEKKHCVNLFSINILKYEYFIYYYSNTQCISHFNIIIKSRQV